VSVPLADSSGLSSPEPWLRGPLPGVHPLVTPVFFTFAQVREELAEHTAGLSSEQVWRKAAASSLGFHLKHLAGSVDRLTTYLTGAQLTAAQLEFLRQESASGAALPELLGLIDRNLSHSQQQLTLLDPHSIFEPRVVGRRALPTTVIGLLVHLAEHTQRHLGQAITLTKLLRT
jgi:uncharacterized damage-inducible protein DinB